MNRHIARWSAQALVCIGIVLCSANAVGGDAAEQPQTRHHALGVPQDGFPSYTERAVLYLTNRARTEPDAFNADDPYPPTPPLVYDRALGKAARWQARHIVEDSCWCDDHSSCCAMEAAGEGGQCVGASSGCGATSAGERVGYWSNQYSGENAANGYQSPTAAVSGWISSPGHWQNINSNQHSLIGPGHHGAGWVQVFGRGGGQPPVAADGVHLAQHTSATFGITYYQPSTGGPNTIMAIVDGQCHELGLAYGEPELGAFEATVSLPASCHRYYFHITDGAGDEHTYPAQGSLAVAVGDAQDCPLYSPQRPADTCSPSGQPCETGHTRPCYTGPWGTDGVGICEPGVERCIGGSWTGECLNQTSPADEETCGNGLDDTCSGVVDDGCAEAADAGVVDAADASGRGPGGASDGCATAPQGAGGGGRSGLLLLLLVGSTLAASRSRASLPRPPRPPDAS